MIKYRLIVCLVTSLPVSLAGYLPMVSTRNAVKMTQNIPVLLARFYSATQNGGSLTTSMQKTLNALDVEKFRLHDEKKNIENQLHWLRESTEKVEKKYIASIVESAPRDNTNAKSPYEGKDLDTLKKEEFDLITKILSVKEVLKTFYEDGPNGIFWKSDRCKETRTQYLLRERELYRELDLVREYKRPLESEAAQKLQHKLERLREYRRFLASKESKND